MAKREPNLEKYYQVAKKALEPFPLRTAELERDYAIEWMASCNSYQDALNEALQNIRDTTAEVMNLRIENMALKLLVASKDQSFKPPPMGLA